MSESDRPEKARPDPVRGELLAVLPLRDIVSLWAASHGLDDNAESMLHDEAAGVIVDLIRHGIVLPAEIVTLKN